MYSSHSVVDPVKQCISIGGAGDAIAIAIVDVDGGKTLSISSNKSRKAIRSCKKSGTLYSFATVS